MFVHHPKSGVNTLWDVTRARLRTAIRAAMRDAQIPTVTELVKRAQITRNTLYNWEGGITAPALDELDKVALALDVPLSTLVDAWSGRQAQQNAAPDIPKRLEKIEAIVRAIAKETPGVDPSLFEEIEGAHHDVDELEPEPLPPGAERQMDGRRRRDK